MCCILFTQAKKDFSFPSNFVHCLYLNFWQIFYFFVPLSYQNTNLLSKMSIIKWQIQGRIVFWVHTNNIFFTTEIPWLSFSTQIDPFSRLLIAKLICYSNQQLKKPIKSVIKETYHTNYNHHWWIWPCHDNAMLAI